MSLPKACDWIKNEYIRPYFFVRKDNWLKNPGEHLKNCSWFDGLDVLQRDPLSMKEENFARTILEIEGRAFQQSGMPMPGWVFFDCGLIPGIVSGFCYKTDKLPETIKTVLGSNFLNTVWTPLSLFIAIPCGNQKEWVAHNLSSINALLPKEERFYGLGFLSKAFGLWYANIDQLCGMTQWQSPALKLHVNYGDFSLLTAYTPVHSHPQTLTYRCKLDFQAWERFFTKEKDASFDERFNQIEKAYVNPKDRESLIWLQKEIENDKGPFYLKPDEIRNVSLADELNLYTKK